MGKRANIWLFFSAFLQFSLFVNEKLADGALTFVFTLRITMLLLIILVFVFKEFVKITTTQKAPFPVLFLVLIDDRRLPSFKTRCGLLWWPPWGTKGCSFDCRCKDTKNLGIRQILACDKGRFSAKYLRFETSLKNGLYFLWGASLCFCGIENYVLRYKSAYYEVIPDCMETYSVFSFFRSCYHSLYR